MTIELTDAAKERLIEIGFDPTLGARPLRRAMQREVEDRLSERILHGELHSGDHIHVDFAGTDFVFTNGPRGEKVAVGQVTPGAIAAKRGPTNAPSAWGSETFPPGQPARG